MVLASAVRRVWLKKVFSVCTSGIYVLSSCHHFSTTLHHILLTFLCLAVHSLIYQYCPSFVRRSSGIPVHLPKGGYDPKEASRRMAEQQNIRIKAAVCKRRAWVEVGVGARSGFGYAPLAARSLLSTQLSLGVLGSLVGLCTGCCGVNHVCTGLRLGLRLGPTSELYPFSVARRMLGVQGRGLGDAHDGVQHVSMGVLQVERENTPAEPVHERRLHRD